MLLKSVVTVFVLTVTGQALAAEIVSLRADLADVGPGAKIWSKATEATIDLIAQPMYAPRPKVTTTSALKVRSLHDDKQVAFLLQWSDVDVDEAGKLGKFSDAVAIQFPVKPGDEPPTIVMGSKDDPVHIFHWRAQYQRDAERGKPTVKELYPNVNVDMYPLEYADHGRLKPPSESDREVYSPAVAMGNPQGYKKNGVDEIIAEGFTTSSVQKANGAKSAAQWKDKAWSVVITRPLVIEGGSSLVEGKNSFAGFAVWQGGKGEVGSRKSVTMSWTPLKIAKEEVK